MTDEKTQPDNEEIDGLFIPWFGWWLWDSEESRKPIFASDSADSAPFRNDNEGGKK